MLVTSEVAELRAAVRKAKNSGFSVGFVPTMGALHQGHLSLVQTSKANCQFTIVSIFVNPLQFNNSEDLEKYPRDLDADLALLKSEKVDLVFTPDVSSVYPGPSQISIGVGSFARVLEGKFRPDHFEGVAMVVTKLFNMASPDTAFFGLKDLQQFMLIRHMASHLSFDIDIRGVETMRSSEGLALSSRNQRLSTNGIAIANEINKGLFQAKNLLLAKMQPTEVLRQINFFYQDQKDLEIEYCEIVDPETFLPINTLDRVDSVAICIAAYVEGIRLIDNVYLRFD